MTMVDKHIDFALQQMLGFKIGKWGKNDITSIWKTI